MSFVDIVILLIVVLGAIIGFMKGMLSQISSIGGIILGLVACNLFGKWATGIFGQLVPESAGWPYAEVTVTAVANIVLFILVFLSVMLLGGTLKSIVKSLKLGIIDKVGGLLLCVFKWMLAFSIVLNVWHTIKPDSDTFTTCHMMNNVPFEVALDLAPFTFGMDEMPSRTLKVNHDKRSADEDFAILKEGKN